MHQDRLLAYECERPVIGYLNTSDWPMFDRDADVGVARLIESVHHTSIRSAETLDLGVSVNG
jgi:hypothetical protein